jgi:hypothetical protein
MFPDHKAVLKRLVEKALGLPGIVAVGAYGSTASELWSAHSDLDLIFIMEQDAPVNSVHFFLDGIPVDLNLKQRARWTTGDRGWLPPEPVTPLWDPAGLFRDMEPPTRIAEDAAQDRYAHTHRLLKLRKWIGRDDEIADLLAAGATHWIAVTWFHARNLRFPGIDLAVARWRVDDPDMIDLLTGAARDRHDRLERIATASERALAPVGGLWREGEIHMTGWHGPPGARDVATARTLLSPVFSLAGDESSHGQR